MDGVPFEELDPCCQKEVLLQRREKEFKERIQRYDRSNHRNHLKKSIFSRIETLSRCHCCHGSQDYYLLRSIREKETKTKEQDVEIQVEKVSVDGEESDDDFDIDEEDYISPMELLRKEQFKTQVLKFENLKLLGFTMHLHESSDHLLSTLKSISVPIIVHICFPENIISAYIDLNLEQLSLKYSGTLFRRINIEECHPILSYFNLSMPISPVLLSIDSTGSLIDQCSHFDSFHAGMIFLSSSFAHPFAGDGKVLLRPLEDYLDHLHVLLTENLPVLELQDTLENEDDEIGDTETEDVYCEEPGCQRNFPHSHISNTTTDIQFKKSTNVEGMEVFEKNYLSRV